MPRSSAPSGASLALCLSTIALVVVACASSGASPDPAGKTAAASSAAAAAGSKAKPSFELTVSAGPDGHTPSGQGTYASDPASTLGTCTHATDGSWRYLYGGGDPFVNIDLLIGPKAQQAGGEDQVALELNAGPGYVRFDPSQMRGGDEPGRSTATVVVTPGSATTTFDIKAVTPDKKTADDVAQVSIDLSVTCPN